jgi:Undecaprenyl-phosphate galactose phosphotransferase WbaP
MISGDNALLGRPTVAGHLNRKIILPFIDAFAIVAGYVIVLGFLAFRPDFHVVLQLEPARVGLDLAIIVGLLAFFERYGHYHERRPFWQEAGEVVLAFAAALLIDAALLFFMKIGAASRLTVVGIWTLSGVLLLTLRYLAKSWLHARGLWSVPAVIVGVGPNARDLAMALLEDPVPAYLPVAFVDPAGVARPNARLAIEAERELPVLGAGGNPYELVQRFGRTHVIVAMELEDFHLGKQFVDQLSRAHKDVELVLPWRGLPTRRSYRTRYVNHDLTTIRLNQQLDVRWQAVAKRCFDLGGAVGLSLFVAPLFAILALLVGLTGRPIFFAHERIGRHGRPFHCYKFRTMAVDAEARLEEILASDPAAAAEWRQSRKLKNDPRVTRIGVWLRKTSLDELPQLLNVLRGDMSLVGPRPVTREEVEEYGSSRIYYLQARPGITGLWQVSGRNDLDFRRRVHLDTWYVKNWSLLRDIVILVMTVRVVFARNGAY